MNATMNVNWVPGVTLEEMEKQCILAALRFYRGNKTQTASVLGIAIRTLDNKLEKYDADFKRYTERFEADRRDREDQLARHRGLTITQQNSVGSAHQIAPRSQANGETANSGIRAQPTFEAPPKHAVPVSQPKEVQSVLPKHANRDSQRRGR